MNGTVQTDVNELADQHAGAAASKVNVALKKSMPHSSFKKRFDFLNDEWGSTGIDGVENLTYDIQIELP
eukprot:487030-Rhodomonas_salina.1